MGQAARPDPHPKIFQPLAHPTRIAVVEALREGELSAGALLARLSVEPANLSQPLAVLRSKQVVVSRKAGNQVYYTLRDPVLVEHLVKVLGAPEGLRDALARLAARGDLIEFRPGQYEAARISREYVVGRISVHRDGYGFLVPDAPPEWLAGDLFLPPDQAERAMHGDRAVVRLVRRAAVGRAEGEVVRIVKRAHATVVGEFRMRPDANFDIPHDNRIRHWIEIPEGLEKPPLDLAGDRIGAAPVEVTDGVIVNVEILDYPDLFPLVAPAGNRHPTAFTGWRDSPVAGTLGLH